MINLIPYNSTSVAANYRAPSRADSQRFQSILAHEYQLFTTVRVEMGADIDGACGQLALENQNLQIKPRGLMDDTATADMASTGCNSPPGHSHDIEDLGRTGANKKQAATTISKRRNGPTSASASSSPAASSATSSSTCCTHDSALPCDCEMSSSTAAAACSSSSSAAPVDEDDLTIGAVLKQRGIKTYAETRAENAAGPVAPPILPPSASPYLSPSEVATLANQRAEHSWQRADKWQQLIIGFILLIIAAVLVFVKSRV
jgi:hypothetical protein